MYHIARLRSTNRFLMWRVDHAETHWIKPGTDGPSVSDPHFQSPIPVPSSTGAAHHTRVGGSCFAIGALVREDGGPELPISFPN